jgi:hypothetical protein
MIHYSSHHALKEALIGQDELIRKRIDLSIAVILRMIPCRSPYGLGMAKAWFVANSEAAQLPRPLTPVP